MSYVYGLFYVENEIEKCFYIGKGSRKRMWRHFQKSQAKGNLHKYNKINKLKKNGYNPFPRKIVNNITEEKALELERFLISEIGLENLTNLSEGGKSSPSGKNHYSYRRRLEDISASRISNREAAEIKWLSRNTSKNNSEIAKCYNGVNHNMVSKIRNSKTWKNIKEKEPKQWSPSDKAKGKWLYINTNKTQQEIAERFGVDQSAVHQWIENEKINPVEPKDWTPCKKSRAKWVYLNTRLSQLQISNIYKVQQTTISRWFRDNNIKPRKP